MTEAEFISTYGRQAARIHRYCLLRVGSKTEAEDITAEVFARLLAEKRALNDGHLTKWLFTVAHNLCANSRRDRRETALPSGFDTPAPIAESGVDGDVWLSLRRLPEEQRLAVYLRAVEDLDFRTIARLLGKSVGATKMTYYRGVKTLASILLEVSNEKQA